LLVLGSTEISAFIPMSQSKQRISLNCISKQCTLKYYKVSLPLKYSVTIERIVLLDFIHHLVSQKTNKIEELKL
jgi:hypothetical protein